MVNRLKREKEGNSIPEKAACRGRSQFYEKQISLPQCQIKVMRSSVNAAWLVTVCG